MYILHALLLLHVHIGRRTRQERVASLILRSDLSWALQVQLVDMHAFHIGLTFFTYTWLKQVVYGHTWGTF